MSQLPNRDLDHILENTSHLWDAIRGEALFLTGGTGFVGSWLLESFLAANKRFGLNAKIVVLSRNPAAFLQTAPHLIGFDGLDFVTGRASDFQWPAGRFSAIIHAATEQGKPTSAENPLGPFDENIAGTRRVLEFARSSGARKLLFTSSGAVYGSQPADVSHLDEEFALAPPLADPATAYGQSKRVSEFMGAAYGQAYGFDFLMARLFAFTGPRLPLDLNFAAGNFMRDALAGGPIRIAGDGTAERSYLYAADLAIWLWTILFKGQTARPYNVGSAKGISIAQLAHRIAQCTDECQNGEQDVEVVVAQKPNPDAKPQRYVPSNERARVELGLRELISLDEGLRRTFEWYRTVGSF